MGGQRVLFQRDAKTEIRLAIQESDSDGISCEAKDSLTFIDPEVKVPQSIRSGGLGDQVFNSMLNNYFKNSVRPSSHIALAEMNVNINEVKEMKI